MVALQTTETVVSGSNSEDRQSTVYFKISGQRGRPSPGTKKIFYLIACMCNTEHVTCIKNNVTTTCVKQCKKSRVAGRQLTIGGREGILAGMKGCCMKECPLGGGGGDAS